MSMAPKLRRTLPVLVELADGRCLDLRSDVPATRADCPELRPCGHVRCKHHLWIVDRRDHDGHMPNGDHKPSMLRPRWLEEPVPASCALDVAEQVGADGKRMELTRIAELLHISEDWAAELLERALARMRAETAKSK
jgi:hypothetical protein